MNGLTPDRSSEPELTADGETHSDAVKIIIARLHVMYRQGVDGNLITSALFITHGQRSAVFQARKKVLAGKAVVC